MSFFIRTDANAENRVMNGTECDVAKMPSARAKFSSWWNWIWQLYHVWNPRERTKRYKLCCWKFLVHAFYLWVKGYIKNKQNASFITAWVFIFWCGLFFFWAMVDVKRKMECMKHWKFGKQINDTDYLSKKSS